MASTGARAATIGGVGTTSKQERADRVVERRKRLGYFTRNGFVTASGLGRDAVKSAEEGRATDATYDRIEAWLDAAEAQQGLPPLSAPRDEQDDAADPQLVTFRLRGNFGVEVTVSGPVGNLDELEEKVERLLERMERPEESD